MKLLKKLYSIPSQSGKEKMLSNAICNYLKKLNIPFETDEHHQIFSLIPDTPLLVAHLDSVPHVKPATKIIESTSFFVGADGNLGADDKNGVWILLNVLRDNPGISFIFSTQEEIGGKIHNLLDAQFVEACNYCLVLDRKGSGDIIGAHNDYCGPIFEGAIAALGAGFGFAPEMGVYSDADILGQYLPTVNLSVGYYHAHTAAEYTKKADIQNSLAFVRAILAADLGHYELEEIDRAPIFNYCDYKRRTTTYTQDIFPGYYCECCDYWSDSPGCDLCGDFNLIKKYL